MAPDNDLIAVIGRGHSGTRMLSQALFASGVFLGRRLNHSADTVPPEPMYEACRIIARHVEWEGGLHWSFKRLHTMPVDPQFEDLVRSYLKDVLAWDGEKRGWKLPETTLAFPWIARMLPEARYVHIVRDPRDGLLGAHVTDHLDWLGVRCPETEDILAQRVASWKYQHEIVKSTPRPRNFISIRFEDLVLDQETTMQRLEAFLGIPLARVVADRTRVGRWKSDPSLLPYVEPLAADIRELGYAD